MLSRKKKRAYTNARISRKDSHCDNYNQLKKELKKNAGQPTLLPVFGVRVSVKFHLTCAHIIGSDLSTVFNLHAIVCACPNSSSYDALLSCTG